MTEENVVEIRELTRRFWRKTALTDITLDIPRGIVFGLVGENGAGKTTLIKHLLGLLKAQQGTVSVFGLDPVEDPVGVLGRIGYLSESRELPDWMRIGQFMSYSQAFYPPWDTRYAEELREMFELAKDQRIKSLSRGQRARVGLLAALAQCHLL
ncbi:MAG: ABC transporter ATP-binding protein [Pirellulaceae bacterium]